jgi:hypothetical protein
VPLVRPVCAVGAVDDEQDVRDRCGLVGAEPRTVGEVGRE